MKCFYSRLPWPTGLLASSAYIAHKRAYILVRLKAALLRESGGERTKGEQVSDYFLAALVRRVFARRVPVGDRLLPVLGAVEQLV